MKEALHTIPVNEAFEEESECPVCRLYQKLESDSIDFVMGSSYMEDDVRMETDRTGFCKDHLTLMYQRQNRQGLSLMLLTYMDRQLAEMEKRRDARTKKSLFKKDTTENALMSYMESQRHSCYVCKRMEKTYRRYLSTLFYLYEQDEAFEKKLMQSKGLCMTHFEELYRMSETALPAAKQEAFQKKLTALMIDNFRRVRDDLEWYTDKFDYRNQDAPWKNSKDALIRALQKTKALYVEEGTKKKSGN